MLSASFLAVKWYPVLFDTPSDRARTIFFWLTVALMAAVVLCSALLRGEKRRKFFKIALPILIGYAAVVGITMLCFTFVEDGILPILFIPLLILIVALAGGAIALYLKRNKALYIAVGCTVGAALIATLVCMGVYYGQNIEDDGYFNSDTASVNQIVLYVVSVLLVAAIIFLGFFFGRKDKKGFDSRSISYAAVCIAMSFALSYLKILKLPQGGSITIASLVPLMFYSFMFGTKKGVFAGIIYGVLQALQDPYIIHPAQFLLDYPVAFSAIGLAGAFAKTKSLEKLPQLEFALGAVLASVLRFVCHLISGVFAFSAYAVDAGMNVWVYSLAYNSFVFADIAIAIAVGVLALSSKSLLVQMRKFNRTPEKPAPAEKQEPQQN